MAVIVQEKLKIALFPLWSHTKKNKKRHTYTLTGRGRQSRSYSNQDLYTPPRIGISSFLFQRESSSENSFDIYFLLTFGIQWVVENKSFGCDLILFSSHAATNSYVILFPENYFCVFCPNIFSYSWRQLKFKILIKG